MADIVAAERLEAPPAPAATCPNCASPRIAAFCADCGERQPSHVDTTLRHLAAEAYEEFVNIDGRLWRSIVALLSRPGFLAQEYFAGRRSRYMRPFSLFVLLNVFLFVVQPHTGLLQYDYADYVGMDGRARMAEARRAELGVSSVAFAARFDDTLRDQKKSMLLFAIPMLALALALLYAGSERTYVEHIVFAVHGYAFMIFYALAVSTALMWVFIGILMLAGVPGHVIHAMTTQVGLIAIMAIGLITYFTLALRRFYHSSWAGALSRATALFAVQGALFALFHDLLFHTVLLSL